MNENQSNADNYARLFQELASLINRQPPETRQQTRRVLGEYLHDIKDTLGLIMGASAVITRDIQDQTGTR